MQVLHPNFKVTKIDKAVSYPLYPTLFLAFLACICFLCVNMYFPLNLSPSCSLGALKPTWLAWQRTPLVLPLWRQWLADLYESDYHSKSKSGLFNESTSVNKMLKMGKKPNFPPKDIHLDTRNTHIDVFRETQKIHKMVWIYHTLGGIIWTTNTQENNKCYWVYGEILSFMQFLWKW